MRNITVIIALLGWLLSSESFRPSSHSRWRQAVANLYAENEPIPPTTSKSTTKTIKSKVGKKKVKEPEITDMVMYNKYDNIAPWKLSDSFNSTTLKFMFDIQDRVNSGWAKIEQTFASWVVIVTSKVERDIKTTFRTGEVITRTVTKSTEQVLSSVVEVSRPVLMLPTAIQQFNDNDDAWNLIKAGVNPLEQGKLLGNLGATNTKQRAALPKPKASPVLSADSLYRSVRLLPNKLTYDYNRRKTAKALETEIGAPTNRLLGDGESPNLDQQSIDKDVTRALKPAGRSKKVRSYGEDEKDDEDVDEEEEEEDLNATSSLLFPVESFLPSRDVTIDQATRQALQTLQTTVTTSQRQALLGELLWAVQVATDREKELQRQIDVLLEQQPLQKQQQRRARNMTTDVVSEAVTTEVGKQSINETGVQKEGEEEEEGEGVMLARWSMGQVSQSLQELKDAVEACRRVDDMLKVSAAAQPVVKVNNATTFADFLKQTNSIASNSTTDDISNSNSNIATTTTNDNDDNNSTQLDAAVKTLLYGDVERVRRGIEVLADGLSARVVADNSLVGSLGIADETRGWGGGDSTVADRILRQRPLLVSVYTAWENLETSLEDLREWQQLALASATAIREEKFQQRRDEVAKEKMMRQEERKRREVLLRQAEEREQAVKNVMSGTRGDTNDDEDGGVWNDDDDISSFLDVDGRDDNDVRLFDQFDGEVVGKVSAAMMVDDVDWNDDDGTDFEWDGDDDTEWGDDDGEDRPLRTRRIKIKRSSSDMNGNNRGIGSNINDEGPSYSKDSGGSSVVGMNGAMDVISLGAEVIDTTADTITDGTEGKEKVLSFLLEALDITFFLLETLLRTLGPLLVDGGALAASRASEALLGTPAGPVSDFLPRKMKVKRDESGSIDVLDKSTIERNWKLFSAFKKQS